MSKGFVYALINPSIPDAVKVGKTKRSPEERANELSGATGVATDFIVAYYQYFEDCSEAEDNVHAALEIEGYRVSDNREFFSAPLNVVVKAISEAPGIISEELADKYDELDDEVDDLLLEELDDDLASLTLDEDKPKNAWDDVLEQANAFYTGRGDVLEDVPEALRLYKIAAKLGSKEAFLNIGRIYHQGDSVPTNHKKALDYLKAGAQRGNWHCFGEMTILFIQRGHNENARKCLNKYISGVLNNIDEIKVSGLLIVAITFYRMNNTDPSFFESQSVELQKLSEVKDDLQLAMDTHLTFIKAMVEQEKIKQDTLDAYKEPYRVFSEFLESVT